MDTQTGLGSGRAQTQAMGMKELAVSEVTRTENEHSQHSANTTKEGEVLRKMHPTEP